MRDRWKAFVRKVKVNGSVVPYTQEDCDLAAKRLGLRALPSSYSQYVQHFGYGEWESDLEICVPAYAGLVGSLDELVRVERATFEAWKGDGARFVSDMKQLPAIISFGETTMGMSFGWDSRCVRDDHEMQICLLELPQVFPLDCWDLLEFLDVYWLGNKLNEYYPFEGGWPTKPIFTVRQLQKPYMRPT